MKRAREPSDPPEETFLGDPCFPSEIIEVILSIATGHRELRRIRVTMACRLTCARFNTIINQKLGYRTFDNVWWDPYHPKRTAWYWRDNALHGVAKHNLFSPTFCLRGRLPHCSGYDAYIIFGYVKGGHIARAMEAMQIFAIDAQEHNYLAANMIKGGMNMDWYITYMEQLFPYKTLTFVYKQHGRTITFGCLENGDYSKVFTTPYPIIEVIGMLHIGIPFTVAHVVLKSMPDTPPLLCDEDIQKCNKDFSTYDHPMPLLSHCVGGACI